jgi:hypothetical protein
MAKPLVLMYKDRPLNLSLEKVDRTKLYGYVDTEVLDEHGQRCEMATLNGDGNTLVGAGGTAFATLSPSGAWCDKASLQPVDREGMPIVPVKSSFDAPIPLDTKATIDEYLAHNIHLLYKLDIDGDATALLEELRGGAIYTFPFSYRGGLEPHIGFVLMGSDGNVFLAAGNAPPFEFVGYSQPGPVAEDAEASEEEDEIAFDMM